MQRSLRPLLFSLVLLAVGAGSAAAQFIPGGHPRDGAERREMRESEMRGAVLERLNETLREWAEAWNDDDADALAELYARDAVVQTLRGRSVLRSRDEIREAFEETLRGAHEIEVRMMDFGVDSRLAFIAGGFEFQPAEAGAEPVVGEHLIVFRRDGGRWLIRSHLFRES